jgi:hypothetical protein
LDILNVWTRCKNWALFAGWQLLVKLLSTAAATDESLGSNKVKEKY